MGVLGKSITQGIAFEDDRHAMEGFALDTGLAEWGKPIADGLFFLSSVV